MIMFCLGMILTASVAAAQPILAFNDDDTHCLGNPARASREGFAAYLDDVCRGPVTHFFICANAQCAIFDSKTFDPAWKHKDPSKPGKGYPWTLKRLVDAGTDPIAMCVEVCRARGISPWVSMRMNDIHDVDDPDNPYHSTFWREHPELWVMPMKSVHPDNPESAGHWRALDYSRKPVYDYHLAFARELVDRYRGADGIELDWMRGLHSLMRGYQGRLAYVLTVFVRDVRACMNAANARDGGRMKLAVRVPTDPTAAREYGFDVIAWAKEGLVDLVIPCNYYGCVDFLIPYAEWQEKIHAVNPAVRIIPGADSGLYFFDAGKRRMLTLEEYRGWADGLFAAGARDFYLFNLYENAPDSAVWNEILTNGFDSDRMSSVKRRYVVTYRDAPGIRPTYGNILPAKLAEGVTMTLRVGTPPQANDRVSVLLAFEQEPPLDAEDLLTLNGATPSGKTDEPVENWMGGVGANMKSVAQRNEPSFRHVPENVRKCLRFPFPAAAVRRGENALTVVPRKDAAGRIMCCALEIDPK